MELALFLSHTRVFSPLLPGSMPAKAASWSPASHQPHFLAIHTVGLVAAGHGGGQELPICKRLATE